MSILTEVIRSMVVFALTAAILLAIFLPVAEATKLEPDVYDLWNTIEEFENTSRLREFLIAKDWVSHTVTIQELDYILTLVNQLSGYFPDLPVEYVLAMISVESSFKRDLVGFSDDTGLMQVIPRWHQDRIQKYLYDENVDLTDPRLNVMVGMDYLEELIQEYDCRWLDEVAMCYNEGPKNGKRRYSDGVVSGYAEEVMTRYLAIKKVMNVKETTGRRAW